VIGSLFGSLPLGFAQPLVLLGLLTLPLLWWLLRLIPPQPRRIDDELDVGIPDDEIRIEPFGDAPLPLTEAGERRRRGPADSAGGAGDDHALVSK